MISGQQMVEIQEYETKYFEEDFFTDELGKFIWQNYGKYLNIEMPSWRTEQRWQLSAQGWVGYLPVNGELTFQLSPKVAVSNLFLMLEYAYRLNFEYLEGVYESETLDEFYENLANILSLRVIDRLKRGLYKKYLSREEELPYVRGRIKFQELYRKPICINIPSKFQDHTADVDDNRILAWTLYIINRSGLCSERTAPNTLKAFRDLQRVVEVTPFSPADCLIRYYDRLNDDYEILHALCRFFLENKGPTINLGDYSMMPFLIDMSKLYELFVAEWLKKNLPGGFSLKVQDKITFGDSGNVLFKIDLVILDDASNTVKFVLDTKYKRTDSVKVSDIHQIVSYAEANSCNEGILIYPEPIEHPLNERIGEIKVRTLDFSIDGDLETNGEKFIEELFLFE